MTFSSTFHIIIKDKDGAHMVRFYLNDRELLPSWCDGKKDGCTVKQFHKYLVK